MGYHSINQARIHRDYTDNVVIADVYCEELDRHFVDKFPLTKAGLHQALEWVERKMNELSM